MMKTNVVKFFLLFYVSALYYLKNILVYDKYVFKNKNKNILMYLLRKINNLYSTYFRRFRYVIII